MENPWSGYDYVQTVIIDNGSWSIKAGFSADDKPKAVFPTLIATHDLQDAECLTPEKSFVGYDAQTMSNNLKLDLSCPVQRGEVTDWDGIERIWQHIFDDELKVSPKHHPVLLTEPLNNLKSYRENLAEIMFENFKVPAFYLKSQPLLALYGAGKRSGVAVDSGHGLTQILPIFMDEAKQESVVRLNQGGVDITQYLMSCLSGKGYKFTNTGTLELLENMKRNNCYVSQDFEQESVVAEAMHRHAPLREMHQLPDGQNIMIGEERFRAPEMMFQPKLFGAESPGLHEHAHKSIQYWDCETQRLLLQNVVISGGSTMFKGFCRRIQSEIDALAPPGVKVKVAAEPNRKYLTWLGGAIYSSLSTFSDVWITNFRYEECGPNLVHRKCMFY